MDFIRIDVSGNVVEIAMVLCPLSFLSDNRCERFEMLISCKLTFCRLSITRAFALNALLRIGDLFRLEKSVASFNRSKALI